MTGPLGRGYMGVALRRVGVRMTSKPGRLWVVACLGVLTIVTPVGAQPDSNSNVTFQSGILIRKPQAGPPAVRRQNLAWPRLDAGAVLCRTEEDLARLARRRAGDAVDGAVDCQIVQTATAIAILRRKGPGQTEVQPSDPKGATAGWTDAWLPEKAPAGEAAR